MIGNAKGSPGHGRQFTQVVEGGRRKPQAVEDYRAARRCLNFLVGQVMKETRGRADLRELGRIVSEFIVQAV